MRKQFDMVTFPEFVRILQPIYLTSNRACGTNYPPYNIEGTFAFRGPDFFEGYFNGHSYFMNRDYNREDE